MMVEAFHKKFHAPVLSAPALIADDRSAHRYALMKEEVAEYMQGVEQQDLQNIAKELCDILYCVYGTILEHGLQDIIADVFAEVHRSNMSKEYSAYKMIKGPDYQKADIAQFFD